MVWSDPNPLGKYLVQPVPVACAMCGEMGPSDLCAECRPVDARQEDGTDAE